MPFLAGKAEFVLPRRQTGNRDFPSVGQDGAGNAGLRKKTKEEVSKEILEALKSEPCFSITPDRGREFAGYRGLSRKLGAKFYFPLPHQPWARGTNENANGLLREYFPKGEDIANWTDEEINGKIKELNLRSRKCLSWRTLYEVYYGVRLHLAC